MKNKKNAERAALDLALRLAREQSGEARRVAMRLSGNYVERETEERPDFLIHRAPGNGTQEALVGIEHLTIDCFSQKKKNKIRSQSKKIYTKIEEIYHKYNKSDFSSEEEIREAVGELCAAAADYVSVLSEQSYFAYVDSFVRVFCGHEEKIDAYRREIRSLDNYGERIELCFLIEVLADFRAWILINDKGARYCPKGYAPLTNEIIDVIQGSSNRGLDYVVMLSRNPLQEGPSLVRAARIGNARRRLSGHGEYIYEYCGIDFLQRTYRPIRKNNEIKAYESTGEGAPLTWNIEMKGEVICPEERYLLNCTAARRALDCLENQKPVIVTPMVMMVMEMTKGKIVGWNEVPGPNQTVLSTPVLLPYAHGEFESRCREFERKWMKG